MSDPEILKRLLQRVSKLETGNRLIGGHDWPPVIGSLIATTNSIDSSGGAQTTTTAMATLWTCTIPQSNPRMAFGFYVRQGTSGQTTNWSIMHGPSGTQIAAGSTTSTTYLAVTLHIDLSALPFDYGAQAIWTLRASTTAGGTAAIRADYIGGSWTPDAAVAF